MEFLIANGHKLSDVLDYTPRQVAAFAMVAQRRKRFELAETISAQAMAARGDPKEIKKQIANLTDERQL